MNPTSSDEKEFAFNDSDFRFLADLVSKQSGIVLSAQKKDMVYGRLARRLRALGLKKFSDYCDFIQREGRQEEVSHLINAITTNLTHFFREKHHFEHLHDAVLKPLVERSPQSRHLRIWSAACSSGMEPYSIAMTMRSAMLDLARWDARILATDIDTNMLVAAAQGVYGEDQLGNIPRPYWPTIQYSKRDGLIHMPDELKKLIAFKRLNLLEAWPMTGLFDAIFCRNVVIYFDKPTQHRLFNRMADLLKPKGWLYIGHSENLFKVCDRFQLTGRTIYQRID